MRVGAPGKGDRLGRISDLVVEPLDQLGVHPHAGRLVRQRDNDLTTPDVTFRYDAAGNMVERRDASGTTYFDYDPANRLLRRFTDDGNPATDDSRTDQRYRYDAVGNLITWGPSSLQLQAPPLASLSLLRRYRHLPRSWPPSCSGRRAPLPPLLSPSVSACNSGLGTWAVPSSMTVSQVITAIALPAYVIVYFLVANALLDAGYPGWLVVGTLLVLSVFLGVLTGLLVRRRRRRNDRPG